MDEPAGFFQAYGYVIGIIGGIAGILALLWQINDKFFNRPKIKVTTELVYENNEPHKIILKAINNGAKSAHIVKSGFIYSDKRSRYVRTYTGLLTHWVGGGGGQYSDEFVIQEIIQGLKEYNEMIEYGFLQEDNYKLHKGEVPEPIKITLQKMLSNSENS